MVSGLAASKTLDLALRESSRIAGIVATYCDKTEHNEPSSAHDLLEAGRRLRDLSLALAAELCVEPISAYAERLRDLEAKSPMEPLLPAPAAEVARARTWRDLQVAQLRHDRHFHLDVAGLSKHDQLVHISLHLTKLNGALTLLFGADPGVTADFARRRLPDFMLFGVKLATVAGQRLPEDPLPQ
jgi:hypothetical protein